MNIKIVEYPDIEPDYRLTQPTWFKAIIFIISSALLALAFTLFASNLAIIIGLIVVTGVMCLGIFNQLNNACMCPILANKEALYIIASPSGKEFLRLPWQYFQNLELGMHGLNKRGLVIIINAALLDKVELALLKSHLNITDVNQAISISVPTGVANRARERLTITDFKNFFNQNMKQTK